MTNCLKRKKQVQCFSKMEWIPIKYSFDPYWTEAARDIAKRLFLHIKLDRIACISSKGSKSRRCIARIHSMGKAMQTGMQSEPFYSIELLERFYAQDNRQKLETLIHELLH